MSIWKCYQLNRKHPVTNASVGRMTNIAEEWEQVIKLIWHKAASHTIQSYSSGGANSTPSNNASLDPSQSTSQTASQSVQPFLNSTAHDCNRPTDRMTDYATLSVTVGHIYVCSTAMQPKNLKYTYWLTFKNTFRHHILLKRWLRLFLEHKNDPGWSSFLTPLFLIQGESIMGCAGQSPCSDGCSSTET